MAKSKDKGVEKKILAAPKEAVEAAAPAKKEKEKKAEPGRVKRCDPCKPHEFQDRQYGMNMRVHTPSRKGKVAPQGPGYYCTVCGKKTSL